MASNVSTPCVVAATSCCLLPVEDRRRDVTSGCPGFFPAAPSFSADVSLKAIGPDLDLVVTIVVHFAMCLGI